MIVLGIETSCDETAAAVVVDGKEVLSSVVSSQIEVHHVYGGVVPEIASRKHTEAIVAVVSEAIDKAGITSEKIDAISVTRGPGLVGALLVGFSFAKAYAYALKKPWIGVNHLEGHICSVFLGNAPPDFPFTALLASGGHTSIYYVTNYTHIELLGHTLDDAAGEAYDKVSKMLGLGYPGGKIIDDLAKKGDCAKIPFPRTYLDKNEYNFSFSGLKTAVNRYIQTHLEQYRQHVPDIVASFQQAAVDVLTYKLIHAAISKQCNHIALVGGVAANSHLRESLKQKALGYNLKVHIPDLSLCGDNAAMIAAVGYHYLQEGKVSHWTQDVFSRSR